MDDLKSRKKLILSKYGSQPQVGKNYRFAHLSLLPKKKVTKKKLVDFESDEGSFFNDN
jgi:hypothetical protein